MSLELLPRQMAARLASALELIRPMVQADDAVREVLAEYQSWAGVIAAPGLRDAMKDKAHVLDVAIDWLAAHAGEVTLEPAWVIAARELIANYDPAGMLGAGSDATPVADIERMSAVMWAAVEASGFARSGPHDSRAAESGEPTWVCRVRELEAIPLIPFTADGHAMPPLPSERDVSDAELDSVEDSEQLRVNLTTLYEAWNKEQDLSLGPVEEHLFDGSLTLAQLSWVREFYSRWEIMEFVEMENLGPNRRACC